jgi:hypothetical protein
VTSATPSFVVYAVKLYGSVALRPVRPSTISFAGGLPNACENAESGMPHGTYGWLRSASRPFAGSPVRCGSAPRTIGPGSSSEEGGVAAGVCGGG